MRNLDNPLAMKISRCHFDSSGNLAEGCEPWKKDAVGTMKLVQVYRTEIGCSLKIIVNSHMITEA